MPLNAVVFCKSVAVGQLYDEVVLFFSENIIGIPPLFFNFFRSIGIFATVYILGRSIFVTNKKVNPRRHFLLFPILRSTCRPSCDRIIYCRRNRDSPNNLTMANRQLLPLTLGRDNGTYLTRSPIPYLPGVVKQRRMIGGWRTPRPSHIEGMTATNIDARTSSCLPLTTYLMTPLDMLAYALQLNSLRQSVLLLLYAGVLEVRFCVRIFQLTSKRRLRTQQFDGTMQVLTRFMSRQWCRIHKLAGNWNSRIYEDTSWCTVRNRDVCVWVYVCWDGF